uniref:Uncharacterized protein n=1 Tax=Parascaris equorum TaxID=6256 RepID=A0A914RUX5_PAREQ
MWDSTFLDYLPRFSVDPKCEVPAFNEFTSASSYIVSAPFDNDERT